MLLNTHRNVCVNIFKCDYRLSAKQPPTYRHECCVNVDAVLKPLISTISRFFYDDCTDM